MDEWGQEGRKLGYYLPSNERGQEGRKLEYFLPSNVGVVVKYCGVMYKVPIRYYNQCLGKDAYNIVNTEIFVIL